MSCLRTSYVTFLPDINPLDVPQVCRKYKSLQWWSDRLYSDKLHKGDRHSTCIQAYWVGNGGHIDDMCSNLNAGVIEYFCQNLMVENDHREICMAKVQWFEHPIESTTLQGQLQFWCATLTKPFGLASFLPVTRIKQVCIS